MIDQGVSGISRVAAIEKILAIICLSLLSISAVAAWNAPATGYESSIYSATPPIFWFSVILSIACGAVIVLSQIYTKGYESTYRWLYGFALIFLSFALCLSLFILRGYYTWNMNGDTATHLGYINHILSAGQAPDGLFGSYLIYPILHFYTAEMSLVLDASVNVLLKLAPLYVSLLFIGFMYILSKAVLGNQGQAILATMAACLFVTEFDAPYYLGFMPYLLANFFFPVALLGIYQYLRTRKPGWGVLTLMILLASVPFHPILVIALAATLASIGGFEKVLSGLHWLRLVKIANIGALRKNHVPLAIILGLLAWFVIWFSRFRSWEYTIAGILNLIEIGGETHAMELMEATTKAAGLGYNILEYAIRTELGIIALAAIAGISLPFILRGTLRSRNVDHVLLLYPPLATICILIVWLYLLNIGFGPLRLLFYVFVISALIAGFALYHALAYFGKSERRYLSRACMGAIIIVMVALYANGVLTLYPSPYLVKPNYQTTHGTIDGMSWVFDAREMNTSIATISIAPYRYGDALLTTDKNKAQSLPRVYPASYGKYHIPLSVPYHFGYDKNSSLASAFNFDAYLVLASEDRSLYDDVYPLMAPYRFTGSDYAKLDTDTGLFRLYSNGELDTWYINHRSP